MLIRRIETQRESLEVLLVLDTTTEKEFSFGRMLIERSTMVKTVSAVAVIPQQFGHKTWEEATNSNKVTTDIQLHNNSVDAARVCKAYDQL